MLAISSSEQNYNNEAVFQKQEPQTCFKMQFILQNTKPAF